MGYLLAVANLSWISRDDCRLRRRQTEMNAKTGARAAGTRRVPHHGGRHRQPPKMMVEQAAASAMATAAAQQTSMVAGDPVLGFTAS
jgi:hypothetical protein